MNSSARDGDVILELRDVTKKFGTQTAVNGLSFNVHAGEIVALLGPNGAGKTTTIEMCEGFQQPTTGNIAVFGQDPYTHSDEVRRRVGMMLQGGGAYPGIRVGEMLRLVASYSRNPLDPDWLLEIVDLQRQIKTPYRRLSGGQQQRLSLACALVGRPELLFLDEPTAGLDAQSRINLWKLIAALRRDGVGIVLTTHLMNEAEELADHVVIIDRGSIVASGSPADITSGAVNRLAQGTSAVFSVSEALDAATLAEQLTAASIHEIKPLHYELRTPSGPTPRDVRELAAALEQRDIQLRSFNTDRTTLEDVFLSITGRENER